MHSIRALVGIALLSAVGTAQHESAESQEMGPAAFMWPADRPWSADTDNTPPCGSSSGAGQRTQFPMTNGRLALVAQDETRAVHVGVSYENDPQSIRDFEIFYGPQQIGDLGEGHTCIAAPNPPSNVVAGDNATFFFFYFNEDEADNEAFYACTDVTYVETAAFTTRIPCFNATREDPDTSVDSSVAVTTTAPDGSDPHPEFHEHDDGLSKGAIAGAVVGSVIGALILALGAFFLFRRSKKVAQPQMAQAKDVERMSDTSSR